MASIIIPAHDEEGVIETTLTTLLQKRVRELVAGAPRLVDIRSENPIDIAIAEVRAGKIELVPEDAE